MTRRRDVQVLGQLGPEDSLVLFYAGHGASVGYHPGGEEFLAGYLIPVDASSSHDGISTWIDLDSWLRTVARLPAKHILVILDACHAGIALGRNVVRYRGGGSASYRTLQRRRSRRVITSAQAEQRAMDSGTKYGHSLFTGFLIDGLTHDLRRWGRIVTGSEIALYLRRQVDGHSQSRQTPDFGEFDLTDGGEIIIPLLDVAPPRTAAMRPRLLAARSPVVAAPPFDVPPPLQVVPAAPAAEPGPPLVTAPPAVVSVPPLVVPAPPPAVAAMPQDAGDASSALATMHTSGSGAVQGQVLAASGSPAQPAHASAPLALVTAHREGAPEGGAPLGPHDPPVAVERAPVEAASAEAQYELAKRYLTGADVEKNRPQAMQLLRAAAEAQYSPARSLLWALTQTLTRVSPWHTAASVLGFGASIGFCSYRAIRNYDLAWPASSGQWTLNDGWALVRGLAYGCGAALLMLVSITQFFSTSWRWSRAQGIACVALVGAVSVYMALEVGDASGPWYCLWGLAFLGFSSLTVVAAMHVLSPRHEIYALFLVIAAVVCLIAALMGVKTAAAAGAWCYVWGAGCFLFTVGLGLSWIMAWQDYRKEAAAYEPPGMIDGIDVEALLAEEEATASAATGAAPG